MTTAIAINGTNKSTEKRDLNSSPGRAPKYLRSAGLVLNPLENMKAKMLTIAPARIIVRAVLAVVTPACHDYSLHRLFENLITCNL
jgi:hypothetical protein